MIYKFYCESCGSTSIIQEENGNYFCLYCGTKYSISTGNNIIAKNLTEQEYMHFLFKIAERLTYDDNTPADILSLNIVNSYKIIKNNKEEFYFNYNYKDKEYLIVFDELGIKKIEIPKNKEYIKRKQANDKKFLRSLLINIVLFGILSIFCNFISVGIVISIIILLSKNLSANNHIIEEEKIQKINNFNSFLNKYNLQAYTKNKSNEN